MGIQYLYHDGYPRNKSRPFPEDNFFLCPYGVGGGTFGVLDGVSFYDPQEGPPLLDGITQGQLATRIVAATFLLADEENPLGQILIQANNSLRIRALSFGLSLDEPEHLPGTNIAVAKLDQEKITIANTGDCIALWLLKDGSVGGTPNQAFAYETEAEKTFASIKQKHGGDLNKAWKEWLPIRAKMIRQYQNKQVPNGWGLLTGEPGFEGMWQEFKLIREEVSLIFLATDGFMTREESIDPVNLARKWVKLYREGGLPVILQATREAQARKLSQSHEPTFPEATAIAIEL